MFEVIKPFLFLFIQKFLQQPSSASAVLKGYFTNQYIRLNFKSIIRTK